MGNIRIVRYNDIPIAYNYQTKKVKNINFRIKKDKTINVSVPPKVDIKYVDDFVLKNAEFIFKALSKVEKTYFNENQSFGYGGNIVFLGNKYKVDFMESGKNILQFDIENRIATFFAEDDKLKTIQKIYDNWKKVCCDELATTLFEECFLLFEKYKIEKPTLKFKKLKSRWGSMNVQKKEMTLNIFLLDAPYECIKYVVIHELAHLVEPNHSKQFYDVVRDIMPDYKKWEQMLKKFTTRKRFVE